MRRPALSFRQIWNMNFGFFGIQFGWGLQMANMSAIYEHLGAQADQIAILWLAAPMTGLLIQPIIGYMSDRTWVRLGRRRPYFLVGALLSAAALWLMPSCSALWMAAGLLWILDASINISMEPFRAFVADLLPEEQRTSGFAMQSLFIGLGAVIASALPWILAQGFQVYGAGTGAHSIPLTVRYSFYIGAIAFLVAVLWTVFTTPEYPPVDLAAFRRQKAKTQGLLYTAAEIIRAIKTAPPIMKQLATVQVLTWLGLFCMWLYFPVAIARHIFHAPDEKSLLYSDGVAWGGLCFSVYSLVCFLFSFALPGLAQRLGRKATHGLCLLCGGAGLVSVAFITDKYFLFFSMAGVGIAWAAILSMPYAMLAGALPAEKTGLYMGLFNFFIVIPEIGAALGLGWVMNHLLGNNRLAAVAAGGICLLAAAAAVARVKETHT